MPRELASGLTGIGVDSPSCAREKRRMCAEFPPEQSADGTFERQEDAFRHWITADGGSGLPAVAGRYHLYISLACPWASRVLIVRNLLGLADAIGCTVVDPVRDERGWAFREGPRTSRDPVNGFEFLSEAYLATDPDFSGRVTVPVLWDCEQRRIVNNSEDDLCRICNDAFRAFCPPNAPDLFPAAHAAEQTALADRIYQDVNNGVYRAGFATSQRAYAAACTRLFTTLDELDTRLADRRYLLGASPLEVDWRLFCTLVRFDAVYHGHFKCNLRRIVDYPHLSGYLRDLFQLPGIAATVDFDHIKRHYYVTHREINPTGIVPLGPVLDLDAPHGRGGLGC